LTGPNPRNVTSSEMYNMLDAVCAAIAKGRRNSGPAGELGWEEYGCATWAHTAQALRGAKRGAFRFTQS